MIPNYIDQENPRLDGERKVFKWLSDNTVPGVAMHSLLQKNQKRKIIGEADYLYITNRGILCIEVKGGKTISRREGQWYSTGKNGIENKIKDPFRQASDCMYALKKYLLETYGYSANETQFLLGYSIVFPECIFTGTGNDLVTEIIYDCKWDLDRFPEYIERTFEYWEKQEAEKHNFTPKRLTDSDINKLVNLLRGDFSVVPSLNLEMQDVERQLLELTEEQYDALDVTLSNKQVIITGVAGTGKSLLAIEKARKMIASNKKIAYICFNKNMAKYVQKVLKDHCGDASFIGTYHKLIQTSAGIEGGYKLSITEISRIFLEGQFSVERYDCLIVDEGQDLMNVQVWETLDKYLSGGLDNGEWVIFLDPNQNIFNKTKEYDFAWDYLKEVYKPAEIPLTKNCRNTEQIGRRTTMVTGVQPAKYMKVKGPKVEMKTYASKEEAISKLKKDLTSLLGGGTAPEDIVILSKYKLGNSVISGKSIICGLQVVEAEDITNFKKRALNYFTVQSFKGLESKIVFMIDVDGFESDSNKMLNYVGMSRAKILLYVYYQENSKEEYLEVTTKNIDLF